MPQPYLVKIRRKNSLKLCVKVSVNSPEVRGPGRGLDAEIEPHPRSHANFTLQIEP